MSSARLDDFAEFYEDTYQGAYRVALAVTRNPGLAADATQDAYVLAFRRRDQFRGEGRPEAWLHRIVVNVAIGALRRRPPIVRELDLEAAAGDDLQRRATDRMTLFAALDQLAPRHRAAVVLRYYHGYDYATIAMILATTTTNVGAMLSRSVERLRTILEPVPAAAVAQPQEATHGR